MREVYPPQALFALMNVLSSHDVERSLYTFGFKNETTPAARVQEAKQRLLLATFVQMTYPGSPTIYYGDEVGVTGANDPYDRATYPWPDLGGKPDNALLAQFKALVWLRRNNPVLRRGSLQAPLLVNDHVIVQARQLGTTWAITASNNDLGAQSVTMTLPDACAATTFWDALSHQTVKTDGNKLTLVVPSLFGIALVGK
jgi:glycosidase